MSDYTPQCNVSINNEEFYSSNLDDVSSYIFTKVAVY